MPKKKDDPCYSVPTTTRLEKETTTSCGDAIIRARLLNETLVISGNTKTHNVLKGYKVIISKNRFGPSLDISSGGLQVYLEDLRIDDFVILRDICDQAIDVLQNEAKDFYD